jgi:hypothetical protein
VTFGLGASIVFGLCTGLLCCRFVPRKNKGLWFVFFWVEGVRGVEIHRRLSAQYGDNVLRQRRVYDWIEMFKNGWTTVADAERSGRPSTSTSDDKEEQDRVMILHDRRTVRGTATRLGISHGSAHSIAHDILRYHRVCARWVPKFLTRTQAQSFGHHLLSFRIVP